MTCEHAIAGKLAVAAGASTAGEIEIELDWKDAIAPGTSSAAQASGSALAAAAMPWFAQTADVELSTLKEQV